MRAIFFGDAHLTTEKKDVERVERFLEEECKRYDMVFLMGDIFEFFYSEVTEFHPLLLPIMESLKGLARAGRKVIFLEGNHEFRLKGEKDGIIFARELEIGLDGMRIFLAHGDAADNCFLKKVLSSPAVASLVRLLGPSLSFRVAIASRLCLSKREKLRDSGVPLKLRLYAQSKLSLGYDVVILAHSHKAERCELDRGRLYLNTGDFTSRFDYLVYETQRGFRFKHFRDRGGPV